MIALSKTLDPADFDQLQPELALVDVFFHSETEQHPMRRWEYALALAAVRRWQMNRQAHVAYDVGGAGSPWFRILGYEIGAPVTVIDPAWVHGRRDSLETFVRRNPALADLVTCLSVLEHVEDLDHVLYHLSCLVAPGGLLFLTVDYCGEAGPGAVADRYHFHWMRKRIFTGWSLVALVEYPLQQIGFTRFGKQDLAWHGPHVYDYSFASLALEKRP